MRYRREIDGLRALAVIPVVLFHAGFTAFQGGFVGVDVFFVISGYLITSIVLEENRRGTFTLRAFYIRRARRILPALLVVLACSGPAAWFLLLPSDTRDFAESVLAALFFVSNVLFWLESGYFDTASTLKPLLNTWSLGVEGQFYLLFPLFALLVLRKRGERGLWLGALAGFALSLGAAQWLTSSSPAAAFYLLPTRAWELLLGVLVALVLDRWPAPFGARLAGLLALLGIGAILLAVFAYDATVPFPGLPALLPTLGAALVILGARSGTLAQAILGNRLLVGIGLISYSLYLWHYPLFVFHRWTTIDGGASIAERWGLIALATILSLLTWVLVERPFRRPAVSWISRLRNRGFYAAMLLFVGAFGIYMQVQPAAHTRMRLSYPENVVWRSLGERIRAEGPVCDRGQLLDGLTVTAGCVFGDPQATRTIVLLGDSHSEALSLALDGALRVEGLRGVYLQTVGCEPLPFMRRNRDLSVTDCDQRHRELIDHLRGLDADVILLNRWSFRLYPVAGAIEGMPYRNSEGHLDHEEYREYDVYAEGALHRDPEVKAAALRAYLEELASASRRLFLIDPVPESAVDIALENAIHFRRTGEIVQDMSFPRADYVSRTAFVRGVFDEVAADNVVRVATEPLFCGLRAADRCYIQLDTVPLYYDGNHPSEEGAALIVASFIDQLAGSE